MDAGMVPCPALPAHPVPSKRYKRGVFHRSLAVLGTDIGVLVYRYASTQFRLLDRLCGPIIISSHDASLHPGTRSDPNPPAALVESLDW